MSKKHTIDSSEELWREVLKYKIDGGFRNINEAVLELLRIGLNNTGGGG